MYKDFKKNESLDTGFVGGSGILWMFSGIVLGLLFGLGMYYFSNDRTPRISIVDSLQNKIKSAQSSKSIQEVSSTKINKNTFQKNKINNLDQQKPRKNKFSYYAVLPTLDVPVSSAKPIDTGLKVSNEKEKPVLLKTASIDVNAPETKKQVKPASLGDYLLQVASFKKHSMADKTRGRLNSKGINAYIQKKKVKGRFWYRVVAGPVDQHSVDGWKLTAEKLGHRPLVISVR